MARPDPLVVVDDVTCRLTEGLSSAREPLPDAAPQPALPAMGLSGACDAILAGVPTCAGVCRFVRVIRVLDPSRSRTCVTAVLAAAAGQPPRPRLGAGVPARGPKTGRRRPLT